MSRSSYYYTKNKEDKDKKNKSIEEAIKSIQEKNKLRYGYRRVTSELRNMEFLVNHKKEKTRCTIIRKAYKKIQFL